jgi:hypothetical protein
MKMESGRSAFDGIADDLLADIPEKWERHRGSKAEELWI